MLGSRRATVTLSAGILQAVGLIRYHRGQVTIVDRVGLESAACECYGVIKSELDGVVQKALRRSAVNRGHPQRSARAVDESGGVEITGTATRLRPTVRHPTT
jgi:hypothetical protein